MNRRLASMAVAVMLISQAHPAQAALAVPYYPCAASQAGQTANSGLYKLQCIKIGLRYQWTPMTWVKLIKPKKPAKKK